MFIVKLCCIHRLEHAYLSIDQLFCRSARKCRSLQRFCVVSKNGSLDPDAVTGLMSEVSPRWTTTQCRGEYHQLPHDTYHNTLMWYIMYHDIIYSEPQWLYCSCDFQSCLWRNFTYCRFLIKFEKFITMLIASLTDVFVRCRILNSSYNPMYISKPVFWDLVVTASSSDGASAVHWLNSNHV